MSKRQKLSGDDVEEILPASQEETAHHPGVKTQLEDLSDELLLKILQHLPRKVLATAVSLVNNHFKNLAMDSSLWTQLTLSGTDPADQCLRLINSLRWSQMRQLTMRPRTKTSMDTNSLAILALKNCPRLEVLSINRGQQVSAGLVEAIGKSLSLRQLFLDGMSIGGRGKALVSKGEGLRYLTRIELVIVGSVTDDVLRSIAHHCTGLETFQCQFESDRKSPSKSTVEYFMKTRACSLKDLCVDDHWIQYEEFFDGLSLCQKVEVLNLYSAMPLQQSGLKTIVQLSKLKTLKIRELDQLKSADCISAFGATKLENLTFLQLSCCPHLEGNALRTVTSACPQLLHLSLANWVALTDEGFHRAMAYGVCKKIRTLTLRNIVSLPQAALQDMAQLLPELKVLKLNLRRGVSSDRKILMTIIGVTRPGFQLKIFPGGY